MQVVAEERRGSNGGYPGFTEPGTVPDVSTMAQLDAFQAELAGA